MQEIRVATAQFEHRDHEPQFNLKKIQDLSRKAADLGAQVVSFHEGCVSGYSWIQPLNLAELQVAA